eukprot:scaffold149_cov315-Pinguiococcus_pyrenoidosus.AAC.68
MDLRIHIGAPELGVPGHRLQRHSLRCAPDPPVLLRSAYHGAAVGRPQEPLRVVVLLNRGPAPRPLLFPGAAQRAEGSSLAVAEAAAVLASLLVQS